jgi:DNA-binding winged helix-turn-helix (wHTH) protein
MTSSFRFAEFELDLAAYALRRGRVRIKLEKVPMEVLILLVASAGALVERREIQGALWGADVFVEHDSAINTAIRKIRRALGDDAERPRFVETVVGKGYRFIAPVERRGWESRVPRSDNEAARPSSARWPRTFPSYCVTRGRQEFVLDTGENLLGRDPAARVYVDHASVSRRHARISIRSERAVLEDLKSRNGTYLDGRRIDAPAEIRHGAIIGLGPITLTFLVLSAPASTRPMSGGRQVAAAKS